MWGDRLGEIDSRSHFQKKRTKFFIRILILRIMEGGLKR